MEIVVRLCVGASGLLMFTCGVCIIPDKHLVSASRVYGCLMVPLGMVAILRALGVL